MYMSDGISNSQRMPIELKKMDISRTSDTVKASRIISNEMTVSLLFLC